MEMKKHIYNRLFPILLLFLVACAPMSKETYMANYKEFVEEVKKESRKGGEEGISPVVVTSVVLCECAGISGRGVAASDPGACRNTRNAAQCTV